MKTQNELKIIVMAKPCSTCRRHCSKSECVKTEMYWMMTCPQCGSTVTFKLSTEEELLPNVEPKQIAWED